MQQETHFFTAGHREQGDILAEEAGVRLASISDKIALYNLLSLVKLSA
jgi:hypothetical protein